MRGGFKVEVGLHQALPPSAFLFVLVMDRLSDEVRQESLWTLRIADNILNCSGRRKWVEERWRCVCVCVYVLEKRGMNVNRKKMHVCVRVKIQGGEVVKDDHPRQWTEWVDMSVRSNL